MLGSWGSNSLNVMSTCIIQAAHANDWNTPTDCNQSEIPCCELVHRYHTWTRPRVELYINGGSLAALEKQAIHLYQSNIYSFSIRILVYFYSSSWPLAFLSSYRYLRDLITTWRLIAIIIQNATDYDASSFHTFGFWYWFTFVIFPL